MQIQIYLYHKLEISFLHFGQIYLVFTEEYRNLLREES